VIVLARRWGRYGKLVRIAHKEGLETRYGHLGEITVGQGDQISQGDVIGRVGKSGVSTGYHLHFEIRRKGKPVNPLSYLIVPPKSVVYFGKKKRRRTVFHHAGIMPSQLAGRVDAVKRRRFREIAEVPYSSGEGAHKGQGVEVKAVNRWGEEPLYWVRRKEYGAGKQSALNDRCTLN